jgi:hypothetical protein
MPDPVQTDSEPSAQIAIAMAERNNALPPLHRQPANVLAAVKGAREAPAKRRP